MLIKVEKKTNMPYKGFGKCCKCEVIYSEGKLVFEIIEVGKYLIKQLKITCPKGHSWVSKSKYTYRKIYQTERETESN